MLSRSRECWRQVTIFVCPFSLSSTVSRIRTEGARTRRDAVTASLSSSLSFECHNDTHSSHIIARTTHCFVFLLPIPRAFLSSSLQLENAWLPVIFSYHLFIYARRLPVCPGARRCREVWVRGHTPKNVGRKKKEYEIHLACDLDYSNLVSPVRFHKSRRATRQYFVLMMSKVEAR